VPVGVGGVGDSAVVGGVLGIVVIVALLSDSSLTPEQRILVSQQSGMYP